MDQIPVYYFVISAVVCGALVWAWIRAVAFGLNQRFVLDLSLCALISGFIGARLFHVLYEYPEVYWREPWRIFDLGRGGYVYYGGFLTGAAAGWLFLVQHQVPNRPVYLDFMAPILSGGYAAGRVACLLAGCCYGPLSHLRWALQIRDENGVLSFRQPTPLYATLLESLILITLLYTEKRRPRWLRPAGNIFWLWLALHGTERFFLEFLRDDFRGPMFLFSISGWISLILLGVACAQLTKKATS